MKLFPLDQVFTFLFLMLGPIKIIGPFAKLTRGAEPPLMRRIALRAAIFSSLALLAAAFIGETALGRYGIPLPILALAGGTLLFMVALRNILDQYGPATPPEAPPAPPSIHLAISPIAFPIIVTPYGIAALIIFFALSPDAATRLAIGGMLLGLMLLNLVCMLFARPIVSKLAVPLQILGAVLGIIQVALGLNIIFAALRLLWM